MLRVVQHHRARCGPLAAEVPPAFNAVKHVDPLAAGQAVGLGVVLVVVAVDRGGEDHRDPRQLAGHPLKRLLPVVPLIAERPADVLAQCRDLAGQEHSGGGVDLPGDAIGPVRQTRLVAVVPHDRGGRQSRHQARGQRETPGVVAANQAHKGARGDWHRGRSRGVHALVPGQRRALTAVHPARGLDRRTEGGRVGFEELRNVARKTARAGRGECEGLGSEEPPASGVMVVMGTLRRVRDLAAVHRWRGPAVYGAATTKSVIKNSWRLRQLLPV